MRFGRARGRDEQPATPQRLDISGVSGGSMVVGVGSGNTFVQASALGAQDSSERLEQALTALRGSVEAQTGALRGPALAQVSVLDRAAREDPPDGQALEHARDWFVRNLPAILPALGQVLVHPTVDTALQAAARIAGGAAGAADAQES
ncbi:hypothetical protein [Streptomyces sp. IBSBF 2435]|uniref:hypothetical protein n=1 Tax=Streptomyces sp. IBSBF 2435 TaxID=2903531 RepID=UPI002FDC76A4